MKKRKKKSQKEKGFTIVELLATIVILAIIITLAVSGYNKISINVKQKALENLKTKIETKAEDYAKDTGNLLTNVDELVKKGYLDADDEKGNIKSPVDGTRLNCHIVSIIKEGENLYGQYSEEEECEVNNLTLTNLNLEVKSYATTDGITKEEEIENGKWTNKDVILEAVIKGDEINKEEIKTIKWQSNIENESIEITGNYEEQNKHVVKAEQIINTTYTVTIVTEKNKEENKEDNSSYTAYTANKIVRIDKQRPIIYEVSIEKEKEWTSTAKKVRVSAGDRNGSGIYGYYIGESPNCREVEYKESETETYEEEKEEGEYYICVKDKVGNVSEEESTTKVKVENIDKEAPKIEVKENPKTLGKEDYEFKENVEVTWGDSGVGEINCDPKESKKTGTYEVTCKAKGNNGLESEEVKFEVKHSYPATKTKYSCECNCREETRCWGSHSPCNPWVCDSGDDPCTSKHQVFGSVCCDEEPYARRVCDTCTCEKEICPIDEDQVTLNKETHQCEYK